MAKANCIIYPQSRRRGGHPRSPTDVAAVLDDEFAVLAGILDDVNRKVGVLTKQVSELSVGPQGVQGDCLHCGEAQARRRMDALVI